MRLRLKPLLLTTSLFFVGGACGIMLSSGDQWVAYAKDRYSDLQTFAKVLNLVQEYYVENVDTQKLYQPALAAGVAINPGAEWSVNKAYGRSRLRLCFASPTHEEINQGVAALAETCRREFGVPARSADTERAR